MHDTNAHEFDIRQYLREDLFPHFLCPGCGHGIALRALLWAIHELGISKDRLTVVSGIGCSGRLGAYIDANTVHVTHGRPLAFATGLKMVRPDLEVIVITGDGDCLAIGGNHFIHACRRNLDITCLMLNNEVYGMTGGQVSPTTTEGRFTTTTPLGNCEPAFDACKLAEAAGAGLVGREITLQTPALKNLIREGITHRGFAFIEVISDCTEIYGRKNDLGSSPEMILSQKSGVRPESYGNAVDQPFRPSPWKTGVLARNECPDYATAYRRRVIAMQKSSAQVQDLCARPHVLTLSGHEPNPYGTARLAMNEFEIRLSGTAGQGLLLGARILSEALTLEGKQVAQSQSYEPTSRGELSRSDLVVSDSAVDYPLVTALDFLVVLDQAAAEVSRELVKKGGVVLVDAGRVPSPPQGDFTLYALPLSQEARALGNARVANMVALGALAGLSGICSQGALEQAIRAETPKGFLDLNLEAVREGQRMALTARKETTSLCNRQKISGA